jgi:pimeloyl-ACP methyl ester carboxylesterase
LSEPLVLLPGLNCSAALWSAVELGPALIPVLGEPSVEAQVDRLLDELPDRFALVGLSLGGIVAMALARRAPERVSRLGLMSTTSRPPTSRQYVMWTRQRAALAAGARARDLQRELKAALLSPAARAERPELVDAALAMADEVGEARLDAQLALQATRVDERPGLARLRCPVLVVGGCDDALCSPERHREIHRHAPDSVLVLLERCGHLAPMERPADVTATLLRFLCATET